MTDVVTQSVKAYAVGNGFNMRITSVSIERAIDATATMAEIEGVVEQAENIDLNDTIDVYINDVLAFEGSIKKAVQNEDGIVTITAYDKLYYTHNVRVVVNPQGERQAGDVAADVLEEVGFTVTRSPTNDDADAYVASSDEQVTSEDFEGPREYGRGKNGEPVSKIVSDLATKMGCVVYTTKRGQIRVEPWPTDASIYEAKYIISLDSGESESENKRTIVKGGSPVGESGPAVQKVYSLTAVTSGSEYDPFDPETWIEEEIFATPSKHTYIDKNVTTQREADRTAAQLQAEQHIKKTSGTLELSGNVLVDPLDQIYIPEFNQNIVSNYDTNPFTLDISGGIYGVQTVTHTIDMQDGYVTTITLAEDPPDNIEAMSTAEDDIHNLLAQKIRENSSYEGQLSAVVGTE